MAAALPFLDALENLSTEAAERQLAYAAHHAAPAIAAVVPGIDYAWSKPAISAVQRAGKVFVAQYDSQDASKNLTPARAEQLLAAGIEIVLVYEYGAQDMLRGRDGGQKDASHADAVAGQCKISGIPVYFAADWDAAPGQQTAINAYLDGAAAVVGLDRVGIYGGYWPLSRARDAGAARYYWGTPAWSGTNWATGFTPDIMQGGFVTVGGVQCDLDAGLTPDFGQFPRPKTGQDTHAWSWWTCDGHESLAAVARRLTRAGVPGMSPAHILRATCAKNGGHWDAGTFSWLNDVLGDPLNPDPHTALPAGARLWVLQ